MRIFVNSCFAVAVAGLLLVSLQAGAVESSKTKAEDPVKMCQVGCKAHKDNLAYETCMLKCQETNKSTKPASSAAPAKKY